MSLKETNSAIDAVADHPTVDALLMFAEQAGRRILELEQRVRALEAQKPNFFWGEIYQPPPGGVSVTCTTGPDVVVS